MGRWSRWYLPVSQPPPSGLHGSRPRPASSAAGTISHSISRTIRLYCGCSVTGAASPSSRARWTALVSCQPGEVGEAVVADPARAHEAVQRPQRLLQRGPRVPGVHLVEVDGVHAEPLQRRVERAGEVPGGGAAGVGRRLEREPPLGGEDDPVGHVAGSVGEPAPDDLLGDPGGVDVGGVDEGAARLDEPVELRVRPVLVGLVAERHRAEAELGDRTAAVAKGSVAHGPASHCSGPVIVS